MKFYRIIFISSLFLPLVSHAQFGDSAPPDISCADKYTNCSAFVDSIQAAVNRSGLNINHDYISQMRANCGAAYNRCLPLEKARAIEMEKIRKELRGSIQKIIDASNKEHKRVNEMIKPNFNKIDQQRRDEILKENPAQWWIEQLRRRNALRNRILPS